MKKLAALFSGGKDSTFSIYKSQQEGHEIKCLISILPKTDESLIFHYPNIKLTTYLSKALEIPLISRESSSTEKNFEICNLELIVKQAIEEYGINGLVHGGIRSEFQRRIFQNCCDKFNLELYSPIWKIDSYLYLKSLLEQDFKIMIIGISSMGLEKKWLGVILDTTNLLELNHLSIKNSFDLSFEGGEAETLVIDSPIHKKKLKILNSQTTWDGQRGIFEILDVELIEK